MSDVFKPAYGDLVRFRLGTDIEGVVIAMMVNGPGSVQFQVSWLHNGDAKKWGKPKGAAPAKAKKPAKREAAGG